MNSLPTPAIAPVNAPTTESVPGRTITAVSGWPEWISTAWSEPLVMTSCPSAWVPDGLRFERKANLDLRIRQGISRTKLEQDGRGSVHPPSVAFSSS